MREQDFRAWMQNSLARTTIDTYVYSVQRIETAEGVNVDEAFAEDGLLSLIALYRYTTTDAQNNRPNPTNLDVAVHTLSDYRSGLNKYREFCLAISDTPAYEARENNNDSDTNTSATFGLEKDLQAALRKHIDQLESGLEIVDGGSERSVDSGRIDILAKDSNGTFVIIELKAGTATDSVVAQILGYMGDIAEEENAAVRGIIVASDFNKRVQSASRATSNLELKTYRYNFEFN